MHFQATTTMAIFAGLFASTNARILLGHTLSHNVMWNDNESACNARPISIAGENPCNGKNIMLSHGHAYSVNGCGGTLYLLNSDRTFNSGCTSKHRDTGQCGVFQTWRCPN